MMTSPKPWNPAARQKNHPGSALEAHRALVGMQPGNVPVTYADSEALERDYGFTPKIPIRAGLRAFVEWYRSYYR